jgi:glycosyltransferase involved in cell wall biosynthesis
MITLVVPTRNRAHTLRLVAPSYYRQQGVSEIVFVIDGGTDDTPAVISAISSQYQMTRTRLIQNPERLGAAQSRNVGAAEASNEFVLFCDDDEYLEDGYAQICIDKLHKTGAAVVSGRRVYMLAGERPEDALRRFGNGLRRAKPFRAAFCEYVNGAKFDGDIELPVTNAIILTHKKLLQQFPFDPYYIRGNGWREETDYQMNLFTNGYRILVTNDTHSIHLCPQQVRTGGQRTPRWSRAYWSVRYTRYFYHKYYHKYAARTGLRVPRGLALAMYSVFVIYREYLRPVAYRAALFTLRPRRARKALSPPPSDPR